MLPRLFFENFSHTSFVVAIDDQQPPTQPARQEPTAANADNGDNGQGKETIVGFICGFVSQSRTGEVRRSIHSFRISKFQYLEDHRAVALIVAYHIL